MLKRIFSRVVFVSLIIIIILLALYLQKYQQIVNEGSDIADFYCLEVNPLTIKRKQAYINFMSILLASGSAEQVNDALTKYKEALKESISAEELWLDKKANFGNRWDVNFFSPEIIKKASQLQFDSRKNEYYSNKTLLQLFDEKDPEKKTQLSDSFKEYLKLSNQNDDEYNKLWNNPKKESDLRFIFTKVPKTKCPPENFDFPDTQEFLIPNINTPFS